MCLTKFSLKFLPGLLLLFVVWPFIAQARTLIPAQDTAFVYTINPHTLDLKLKVNYDTQGVATGLRVSYQLPAQSGADHALCLYLDDMAPVQRRQDTVRNLVVTDKTGVVPFMPSKSVKGQKVFVASRHVLGAVSVQYDIAAAIAKGRYGPQVDMQQTGGGLAGSFVSILLLPAIDKNYTVAISWTLKQGDKAISTFGSGNSRSSTAVGSQELLDAQFIVGKLFTYPAQGSATGFSVAGLGLGPQQIGKSLTAYKKTYEYLCKQLRGSPESAFRFFFRSFDGGPMMSGNATKAGNDGSFVLYIPEGDSLGTEDVYNLIAHEMIHVFVKDAETDWYVEGIADYLSAVLPYRAGLTSKANYLKLINNGAAAYYTNSIRLASDSAYNGDLKWSTTNSWILSYSRGMLYFANLDAKLNRLPGQHQTVLSLVLAMNKAGKNASWEKILRKTVGEWAVADYKAMLSGKLIVPEPDAYGKGLKVAKIATGIFDLGYPDARNVNRGQPVKKLDPHSNAAKAGLRDGDIITKIVNLGDVYDEYDKPVTLTVNRGGKILTFTYQPRGKPVEGYQWSAR